MRNSSTTRTCRTRVNCHPQSLNRVVFHALTLSWAARYRILGSTASQNLSDAKCLPGLGHGKYLSHKGFWSYELN